MHVVGSVRSAIAILRFLASQSKAYGVNAIAREIGISPSSCFNIVKTLAMDGVLEFDARDKTYALGPALSMLAPRTSDDEQVFDLIEPQLAAFARRFSCTTSLWRLTRDRLVLINSVRGAALLNVHLDPGLRVPSFIGSMGRCIAGEFLHDRPRIENAFHEIKWQNPPPLRTFLRDAAAAKVNGWAIDIDNYMRGLTTTAAPIRDGDQKIRFCIANIVLSGSRSHIELKKLGTATALLGTAASKKLIARIQAHA
jgi:DNA-binding IclR family transcriptional regulator